MSFRRFELHPPRSNRVHIVDSRDALRRLAMRELGVSYGFVSSSEDNELIDAFTQRGWHVDNHWN
jgi:hypothetical protein